MKTKNKIELYHIKQFAYQNCMRILEQGKGTKKKYELRRDGVPDGGMSVPVMSFDHECKPIYWQGVGIHKKFLSFMNYYYYEKQIFMGDC